MEKKSNNFNWFAAMQTMLQKKNRLFLVGLAGIFLIFLSDLLWKEPSGGNNTSAAQASVQSPDLSSTVQELEERLTQMLQSVQGAGKVQVMITLESTGETVFARDEQSDTQTSDSGAGVSDRRESYTSEHIIIDTQDGSQPLVETYLEPEVKGVAVVCEGGDDIMVIKRITDLVSVVLGLPTNRICVVKMI